MRLEKVTNTGACQREAMLGETESSKWIGSTRTSQESKWMRCLSPELSREQQSCTMALKVTNEGPLSEWSSCDPYATTALGAVLEIRQSTEVRQRNAEVWQFDACGWLLCDKLAVHVVMLAAEKYEEEISAKGFLKFSFELCFFRTQSIDFLHRIAICI